MMRSRMWWAWLAVGLLALSCAAPGALSSPEAWEEAGDGCDVETLESRPPLPTRPPPRGPSRPGRGGRNRNRNRNPFEPREPVFNAEPTPAQRLEARWRAENAAIEQLLRERYSQAKAEAEAKYPGKVGLYEWHHFWPIYLGGPRDGPMFRVPAAYHQLITNAFREHYPYGQPKPNAGDAQIIMMKVYARYPIPQLIGLPEP